MDSWTIGRLAKLAGVNVETVKFYQRKGLLEVPSASGRGGRLYSNQALAQIRFIRNAKRLGFTLKEVATILALNGDFGKSTPKVEKILASKLTKIDLELKELRNIRNRLKDMLTKISKSKEPTALLLSWFEEAVRQIKPVRDTASTTRSTRSEAAQKSTRSVKR